MIFVAITQRYRPDWLLFWLFAPVVKPLLKIPGVEKLAIRGQLLPELHDEAIKKVDDMIKAKEAEIMEV